MRANLVRRLIRDGYRCVADDRNPEVVKSLEVDGANGADSYEEFGASSTGPGTMAPFQMVACTATRPVPGTS